MNSTIVNSSLTSVGTLSNLTVTGNATVGNIVTSGSGGNVSNVNVISANTFIASGNITAANANLGNLTTANFFTGTLTTAAQPNITSVGTLGSLDITGNLSSGNANLGNLVSANYFTGNGINLTNIAGANVSGTVANANYALYAGTVLTNSQPNITSVGTLGSLSVTGNVSSGNANLGNLVSANYFSGDATYLTNVPAGSQLLNGNSNVYVNANANVTISSNGVSNIIVVTSTGVNVSGYLNAGTGNITSGNATLGNLATSNYFSGNGSLLTSITGANVTGTVANATYATSAGSATTADTVTTNAQPNITSVGTLSTLSVTGNVTSGNANLGNLATANYFSGNGSLLTSITGGNVTGTVANATYAISAGSATTAGTVITNAQPNITSVGSLTGLTVSNVTGDVTFTNTATVSLGAVANLRISGGSNGQVLTTNGSSGLTWTTVSGGGGGGSNIANGTSNVNIPTADGNVNTSVGGTANVFVVTSTGANVSGNLTASNISAGAGAGGSITGANLISANYFTGQLSNGNSNINIASVNGNVSISAIGNANVLVVTGTGANITGTANITGNTVVGNLTAGAGSGGSITGANYISANYFYGTLTSGASSQPNLTSLGTLAGLNVSNASANMNFTVNLANFANTSNVYLGAVSNVHIANGTANYFLQTNGAGDLTWAQAIPIITDSDASGSTFYPVYATSTSGGFLTAGITSAKLQFVPSTGQLTVQDLNTLSDATLKENPEAIENPIEILMQLFGMGFNWVDSKKKSYGLMAQMVEKILPELVSTNAQGKKAVNYIPIIAFLIEAVKKQQEDIEALKKR